MSNKVGDLAAENQKDNDDNITNFDHHFESSPLEEKN